MSTIGAHVAEDLALRQRLEKLEDDLRVASEAGLFTSPDTAAAEVLRHIAAARAALANGRLCDAARSLLDGELCLDSMIRAQGIVWRLRFVVQLPLFIFYLTTITLAVAVAATAGDSGVWGVPAWAMSLGATGAVLRGLWFLHYHVSRRSFRAPWLLAHLSAPVVGALLGLLAYLLLMAGLLSVGGGRARDVDLTLPRVVTFLAGYSWEWLLGVVDRLVGRERGGA